MSLSCRGCNHENCEICNDHYWYEPKEKKMKVIVEVEEYNNKRYAITKLTDSAGYVTILKSDCEPVQEGWLTEDEFYDIWVETVYGIALKKMKERGLIKQSKTARQELEEYYGKHIGHHTGKYEFDELYNKAIKALEVEKI